MLFINAYQTSMAMQGILLAASGPGQIMSDCSNPGVCRTDLETTITKRLSELRAAVDKSKADILRDGPLLLLDKIIGVPVATHRQLRRQQWLEKAQRFFRPIKTDSLADEDQARVQRLLDTDWAVSRPDHELFQEVESLLERALEISLQHYWQSRADSSMESGADRFAAIRCELVNLEGRLAEDLPEEERSKLLTRKAELEAVLEADLKKELDPDDISGDEIPSQYFVAKKWQRGYLNEAALCAFCPSVPDLFDNLFQSEHARFLRHLTFSADYIKNDERWTAGMTEEEFYQAILRLSRISELSRLSSLTLKDALGLSEVSSRSFGGLNSFREIISASSALQSFAWRNRVILARSRSNSEPTGAYPNYQRNLVETLSQAPRLKTFYVNYWEFPPTELVSPLKERGIDVNFEVFAE